MVNPIYTDARKGLLTSDKLDKYLASVKIDDEGPGGFTPLILAAKTGQQAVVELLLRRGAAPNLKSSNGTTPLYVAANANNNRVGIVRLLLDNGAKVDATNPEVDNMTPLMVAITQARDPAVVGMLIDAGASLQAKNSRGETAKSLAQMSGVPAIQKYALPPGQQQPGLPELINLLVNFVLFVLAYVNSGLIEGVVKGVVSNLYHIGSAQPDQQLAQEIGNPQTVDDFKKGVEDYVRDSDLGQFFPSGSDYLQKVAEKAVELKDDPRNHLKEPEQIKGLVRMALYQPVFYCGTFSHDTSQLTMTEPAADDSGSMGDEIHDNQGNVVGTRMQAMRQLVQRMSSIATRLVPDGKGAHLRFINRDYHGNDLKADQIDAQIQFEPSGGTNLGTNLDQKVLQPLVYNQLDKNGILERPHLILTVTDGEPNPEAIDTFKKTIEGCGRRLDNHDYPQESVMFLISQVGDDHAADKFLDSLSGDAAIDRVLYRTSERLHEKYADLRNNEELLERWLFDILMKPITG